MSTQTRMNADYLWIRHAPVEEGQKYRNFGHFFTYDHAPNRVERLEMTYRSMGKAYDWQLEKYRNGRKSNDKANKKRWLRNLMRIFKHPLAYFGWTTSKWYINNGARIVPTLFLFTIVSACWEWRQHTNRILQHDSFLLASGKNIEGMSGRYIGYHNTKPLRGPSLADAAFRVPISPREIVLNQTWKQNIRKELHLTNANGVSFLA